MVSVAEAAEAAAEGFAVLPWDTVGRPGEESWRRRAAAVRCLQATDGSLPGDENEAGLVALVGQGLLTPGRGLQCAQGRDPPVQGAIIEVTAEPGGGWRGQYLRGQGAHAFVCGS